MIHFFINLLAASAGGGLTYAYNVIPRLAEHAHVHVTAAVPTNFHCECVDSARIRFVELEIPPLRRFWYEQRTLPDVIRRSGANILLSAGNFALRRSPIPQILLSRNSIYTSEEFLRDLSSRGEYRMWIDTRARAILARKSIQWANVTVAPSAAFAEELELWSGCKVKVIHHGFDREAFTRDPVPLSGDAQLKLDAAEGSFKILFVSHYNYYRNFETLIRSLPLLRNRFRPRNVRLLLTCRLSKGKNPGSYRPDEAARLIKTLGVSDMVVELGTIPYSKLHQLYGRANVYVTPAYTETFAHPLVEAMSSSLPVVASNIAVHREICGDAALYFDRYSPNDLAGRVAQLAQNADDSDEMVGRGIARAAEFSWRTHVQQILDLSEQLISRPAPSPVLSN